MQLINQLKEGGSSLENKKYKIYAPYIKNNNAYQKYRNEGRLPPIKSLEKILENKGKLKSDPSLELKIIPNRKLSPIKKKPF